jgi:hypothetical protein
LRIGNMPSDIEYGGDVEVLKACLWVHLVDVIKG